MQNSIRWVFSGWYIVVIFTLFKEMALEAARADAERKCMDKHEQELDIKTIEKNYSDQHAALQEQLTVSLRQCSAQNFFTIC